MTSTRALLLRIAGHLSLKRKLQFCFLACVTAVAALAELLSLWAILPFLAVLTQPEKIWNWSWVQQVARIADWNKPTDLLIPTASAFAFAAVAASSVRLINLWLGGRFAATIGSDLSSQVYRHILYQPYLRHVQRNTSSVLNTISAQVGNTVGAITICLQAFTSLLVSASLLFGLVVVDWRIAVFAFGLLASSYSIIGILSLQELTQNGRIISAERQKVFQGIQEGLGSIRDLLLDSSQGVYVSSYTGYDRLLRRYEARNGFLSVFPRFALEAIGMVFVAGAAVYLVENRSDNSAALAILGTFALGAQRLLPALQQSYSSWASLKAFTADMSAVLLVLDDPIEPVPGDVHSITIKDSIVFDKVDFSYGDEGRPVLTDLNLRVKSGESLAFIGPSGGGKSTVVDLMMGLLEPTSGRILLDGGDLHCPTSPAFLYSWRKSIAHVPQTIFLSDASFAENIAFGVPKARIDQARVRLVAEQAQISSFIEATPEGYETPVGERGIRLSGGQRQRLGIARALYKQAQVLILDEATSALDNETELAVMNALNKLDSKLTVVMIAHRLSTVAKCDRVIRLDHGRVVADGPPSQVLAQA